MKLLNMQNFHYSLFIIRNNKQKYLKWKVTMYMFEMITR